MPTPLVFPVNPTIGQTFTQNDLPYQWDGESWNSLGLESVVGFTGSTGFTGFTGSAGSVPAEEITDQTILFSFFFS